MSSQPRMWDVAPLVQVVSLPTPPRAACLAKPAESREEGQTSLTSSALAPFSHSSAVAICRVPNFAFSLCTWIPFSFSSSSRTLRKNRDSPPEPWGRWKGMQRRFHDNEKRKLKVPLLPQAFHRRTDLFHTSFSILYPGQGQCHIRISS